MLAQIDEPPPAPDATPAPPAPPKSPFKFLDAYGPEDQDIFFGRDSEIEALHQLSFQSYLVLVYGPSGTGKTSLVQCGLATRFKPSAWLPLTIRRRDDINKALIEALRGAASHEAEMEGLDAIGAVKELFLDQLRPIYLIFDQFEELFIFGTQKERDDFFVTLKQIIDTTVNAKVILIMREEFLARLDRYEELIPTIFSKRLRVDPMFTSQLCAVINGTAAKVVPPITLERPQAAGGKPSTAEAIVGRIANPNGEVQLAYLQVYLDRLYRTATADGSPPYFSDALLDRVGRLGDVLRVYLDDQVHAIQRRVAERWPGAGAQAIEAVLAEFVSLEGTKQPRSLDQLEAAPLHLDGAGIVPAEPHGLARLWPAAAQRLRERREARRPPTPPLDQAAVVADIVAALEQARLIREVAGFYELAHDSLAAQVAAMRSAERVAVLRAEKMVRDCMANYADSRRLLNRDELASLRRLGAALALDTEQQAFVQRSRAAVLRKRFWRIAGLIMGAIVSWIIIAVLGYSLDEAEQSQKKLEQGVLALSERTPDVRARLEIHELFFDEERSKPFYIYNVAEKHLLLGEYDQADRLLTLMRTRMEDNGETQEPYPNFLYWFGEGNLYFGRHLDEAAVTAFQAADDWFSKTNDSSDSTTWYASAARCQLAAAEHRLKNDGAAREALRDADEYARGLSGNPSIDLRDMLTACRRLEAELGPPA
jgi:hypothetical protein